MRGVEAELQRTQLELGLKAKEVDMHVERGTEIETTLKETDGELKRVTYELNDLRVRRNSWAELYLIIQPDVAALVVVCC